jgi:cyclophilin family peptidyl-prolyl cis-trans isomerase
MIGNILRSRVFLLILACIIFWASLWYLVTTAYNTRAVWAAADSGVYAVAGGAILETSLGNVKISLLKDETPDAVKNFIVLADNGRYAGATLAPVETGLAEIHVDTSGTNGDFYILTQDSAAWLKDHYTIFADVANGQDIADDLPSQAKPVTINKILITP